MPTVEFLHSGEREIESKFVERRRSKLQETHPEISVGAGTDAGLGLSHYLPEEFSTGFGSVIVITARSSFLDGTPVRWEQLKRILLEALPQS